MDKTSTNGKGQDKSRSLPLNEELQRTLPRFSPSLAASVQFHLFTETEARVYFHWSYKGTFLVGTGQSGVDKQCVVCIYSYTKVHMAHGAVPGLQASIHNNWCILADIQRLSSSSLEPAITTTNSKEMEMGYHGQYLGTAA